MPNLRPYHHRRRKNYLTPFNMFNDFWDFTVPGFKTDIKETENEHIIFAELPGVNKDDIDISYDNGYLTITATSNQIHEDEESNFIRRERRTGNFERSFQLTNVKENEISASYQNGILEVKLPKENPGKQGRKINIQ